MPKAVSQMLTLLCRLVTPLPLGTNLGLLHLLWMLVSGRLLAARGAVIPGLDACARGWPPQGRPCPAKSSSRQSARRCAGSSHASKASVLSASFRPTAHPSTKSPACSRSTSR